MLINFRCRQNEIFRVGIAHFNFQNNADQPGNTITQPLYILFISSVAPLAFCILPQQDLVCRHDTL